MAGNFNAEAVAAAEQLALVSFTSNDAFELGTAIRQRILQLPLEKRRGAIIDIQSAHGQQLFFATAGEGTQVDNAYWAERKRAAVLRFGKSTASLNVKWGADGIPAFFGTKEEDYAIHGGGFPLRVKGVETVVGVIVVSGLKQEDDHQVIVDSVDAYIKQQEQSK